MYFENHVEVLGFSIFNAALSMGLFSPVFLINKANVILQDVCFKDFFWTSNSFLNLMKCKTTLSFNGDGDRWGWEEDKDVGKISFGPPTVF